MKKIFLSISILFNLLAYPQDSKIENGTYVAKARGQSIKLVLSDNNKYDLMFMSGKYEIKNDSIILRNDAEKKSSFNVFYTYGQNIKLDKIRINLSSYNYDFNSIYIASFNGSAAPIYKRVADILNENAIVSGQEVDNNIAKFEIDRAEFLVLAKENYVLETELTKFKIPENTAEIDIKDQFAESQVLKLSGIFNKETKELTLAENSRNPMTFIPESQFLDQEKDFVKPFETQKISNWTYPGKNIGLTETTETVNSAKDAVNSNVDAAATATEARIFNLKIEKTLKEAFEVNSKTPKKFLVIYYDPKNKNAKTEFESFIQSKNDDIAYYIYDKYDETYDKYNYYLASKTDEKWFKTNKINKFPCVLVLNSNGEILSQANKSLFDLPSQFGHYDDFHITISRINALNNFKKAIPKNSSDFDLIKAFLDVTALELPYAMDEVKLAEIQDLPPVKIDSPNSQIEEIKADAPTEKIEEIKGEPDMIKEDAPVVYEQKQDDNVYTKFDFDKKLVSACWNKLINFHINDVKPNIDLVIIIDKELKNDGFSKQLFSEEKIIDETNFQALDYLFKHFDAIEEARKKAVYKVDDIYDLEILETEIKNILNVHIKLLKPNTPVATQEKIVAYFKKVIDKNNINKDTMLDYFALLKDVATSSKNEKQYIQEYDKYFDAMFDGKTNVIERLNQLFESQTSSGTEYWSEFKRSYANLSNDVSWFVVQNSKNPETIKKAIKWSENSLIIEKNNHYYLDTLAQLYYLNGEKTKAIATQQKAVDNVGIDDIEEYKAVLEKMKNGNY